MPAHPSGKNKDAARMGHLMCVVGTGPRKQMRVGVAEVLKSNRWGWVCLLSFERRAALAGWMFGKCSTLRASGVGFSRFLSLAGDEGESQWQSPDVRLKNSY
jgi:hypothetical protein